MISKNKIKWIYWAVLIFLVRLTATNGTENNTVLHGKYACWENIPCISKFDQFFVDPEMRYIAKLSLVNLQIWSCTNSHVGRLVFDSSKTQYIATQAAATKYGIAFLGAKNIREATTEIKPGLEKGVTADFRKTVAQSGYRVEDILNAVRWDLLLDIDFKERWDYLRRNEYLLLWDYKTQKIKKIPSCSVQINHLTPSWDGACLAIRTEDPNTDGWLETVEIQQFGEGRPGIGAVAKEKHLLRSFPIALDRLGNSYDFVEISNDDNDFHSIGIWRANGELAERRLIAPKNSGLPSAHPYLVETGPNFPMLLGDGKTLIASWNEERATDIDRPLEKKLFVNYYEDGKLVKSLPDPIKKTSTDASPVQYSRVKFTSDGKNLITQIFVGEHKGEVGVWNVETGSYNVITNLPPIHAAFEWRLGKYLPIISTDENATPKTCSIGVLEITQ